MVRGTASGVQLFYDFANERVPMLLCVSAQSKGYVELLAVVCSIREISTSCHG